MNYSRQQGFVLITALIFLLVLSLLGVAAVRSSVFEERLAGNDIDLAFARENAELALRDAERDIMGRRLDGQYCAVVACTNKRPAGTRPDSDVDASTFWIATNTAIEDAALGDELLAGVSDPKQLGLYNASIATGCGKPVWSGANWQDGASPARTCSGTITQPIPTTQYGYFTDAPFLMTQQGVPAPRYLIEMLKAQELGLGGGKSNKLFFRITAVGFGRTSGATGARSAVTLQSVFSP